jgi:hypothetical protein
MEHSSMTRVQRAEFLMLRLRSAIADKEQITKNEAADLAKYGEWQTDWDGHYHEVDQQVKVFVAELDALAAQAPPSYEVHADPEPEPVPTTLEHKPCPLCGGTAVIEHGAMGAGCCVRCLKCGVETAYTLSAYDAWTTWDRRDYDTRLAKLREWLRTEQDIVSDNLKPDVFLAFERAVVKLDSL